MCFAKLKKLIFFILSLGGHRSGGQPDDWQQAITKSNRNLMDPSRMKLTKVRYFSYIYLECLVIKH